MYHGGGGFLHSEVYNMPNWMRRFHVQKINDFQEKKNEEYDKQMKKVKGINSPSKGPVGPNVPPSSTFDF